MLITHTQTHTHRHTNTRTQTHRPNARNVIFGFRGPQNVKMHQNLHFENLTHKKYFLYLYVRESNKSFFLKVPSLTWYAMVRVPSFNPLSKKIEKLFFESCFKKLCTAEITSESVLNFLPRNFSFNVGKSKMYHCKRSGL